MATVDLDKVAGPTGLTLDADLEYDDWAALGQTLGSLSRAAPWWIGDWLVFGEAAYGERYSQAMDATGYEYSTLTNMAWVSRQVGPGVRREGLSWAHHECVAKFEEAGSQIAWLQKAETEGWTRAQLREELRKAEGKPGKTSESGNGGGSVGGGGGAEEPRETAGQIVRRCVLAELGVWWERTHASGSVEKLHDAAWRDEAFAEIAREAAGKVVAAGVKV